MEISWKWLNLCLGLLLFQLCHGFPVNLEDSVADQHTQLLTGLVAVLLTVCSVVLLAGCLCCQRRNGFKEFRDSPVVASAASNLDHGHVNPIANGEFTIFTPLSTSPYNNNVFLANERIITRTAEDFAYEDFDVSSWFNESERDFPRIKLKYIKELGKGWFGKVVEGAAREIPPNEQSWTPVVVRILEASASRKERVLFLNDAAIYRCGAHANVLSLIGRCLDTVPLLLLQEYCSQGDLKNYLRSKKENVEQLLSTDYPLLWCCQLTSGLKHLHSNGVTHPDLATRNCQLASDLTLKIGDYSLSENKYPEDYYQGSPRVPVRWCSPESLTCTPTTIQPKKITTESNIWSLGVTMWEVCECGGQPYCTLSDDEVVSQVFGPPNVRLSRPSFPVLYTDYLYRLMQLCWNNAESRPTVSQIDLMLSDLWQVYKNTKSSTLSVDEFDKRWELFKPNSVVVPDAETEDSETNITKPLSPSLNNLHGSLDNLLDPGDQMELWLENVTKGGDFSLAKSTSDVVLSIDDPIISEMSGSESSDRGSPKQKKSKLKSKIDFDPNIRFRDGNIKQPYNFSDSALFSQRTTSSESETEDENWRKKVERGAYTEKVRLKSRSVADLMILTHVDYSESESETPLPSLDHRVNYRNVRYAPRNNLENASLTYGSEGNLLSVHDTFQEELKKLKEERRDSLLFVPDNHSQNSFNKLDSSSHNFSVGELTLSDPNLNGTTDSTSKRLMRELNRVAEIQPASQVFNVFSVTIDKFKPIHVNSCTLSDIINFSDIGPTRTSEQNGKRNYAEAPVGEVDFRDRNNKRISDFTTETYPSASDVNDRITEADLYQLSNGACWRDKSTKSDDIEPFPLKETSEAVHTPEIDGESTVGTVNPVFFNDLLTSDLETEFSSGNTESNTEPSTPGTVVHRRPSADDDKPPDWNFACDIHNSSETSDGDLQETAPYDTRVNSEKGNCEQSIREVDDKFVVPKLSEISTQKINESQGTNGENKGLPEASKLRGIIQSKIFIDNEILMDRIASFSNHAKDSEYGEFQNEGGVDSNKVHQIDENKGFDVKNDFEVSQDETLCEAKNDALIPKLSEIIKRKGFILAENSPSETDKHLPDLKLGPDTEFSEFPEVIQINNIYEQSKETENLICEQKHLQNPDVVDLNDVILIDVNGASDEEKKSQVPKEYEDLRCETKSNARVPKLSEIIKSKIGGDENSKGTYQVNPHDEAITEGNSRLPSSECAPPEIESFSDQTGFEEAKDKSVEDSSHDVHEKSQSTSGVDANTVIGQVENSSCEEHKNVDLDDTVLINVKEAPEKNDIQISERTDSHHFEPRTVGLNRKPQEFRNKNSVDVNDIFLMDKISEKESHLEESITNILINTVSSVENSNRGLEEHRNIDLNPKENNLKILVGNASDYSEFDAVDSTEGCESQEKLQKKDIVDLNEVVLIDLNKATREGNSQIPESGESKPNAFDSTEILGPQERFQNIIDLNEIVLVGVNDAPEENNFQIPERNGFEPNAVDLIGNVKLKETLQEINIVDLNEIVLADVSEARRENNLNFSEKSDFESNAVCSSETCKPQEKFQNHQDIVIVSETSKIENNLQVPKLSEIILCKRDISDPLLKAETVLNGDSAETIVELSEDTLNKNIASESSGKDQSDTDRSTEQNESHICDTNDFLESKSTDERKHTGFIENDGSSENFKVNSITFDSSGDQELAVPSASNLSVFTSTPASQKNFIPRKDAHSNLKLFDTPTAKRENKTFCSDLVPLDTSKELNYSLETWDSFLGKTLDAQKDVQNENLFDSFSSEPHSLLFVENGNDLVQPHEYAEAKNEPNVNNGTFVIEAKNENTFVLDNESKNETFVLNKSESETEDAVDNAAWGSGGGWFLHPQTGNKEPSGTMEVRENAGSYVGFGIDDEIMAAIRNELLNKLPHAQVAPSEKVAEVEEWDSGEKNEVFLKYNIYNPPLSPIIEESYIEECDIVSPRQESDNEESEWSEPDLPETLPPEAESQSAHTYDSQMKGPHHRHTPSQDSCCSNDTLFNLEDLTCVAGDAEKENDLVKCDVPETEVPVENILESNEVTFEEICVDFEEKTPNTIPDNVNETGVKSETNNNTKDENLNSTNAEETEDLQTGSNLNIEGDRGRNASEMKNNESRDYISEFITQEIEHSSKQSSEGSSSESTEGNAMVFKKTQVAPLPSPEDNPWKQLPASLLSYDKVISQNNSLLLPATESNDVVPEFNDLPEPNGITESQHEPVGEECSTFQDDDVHGNIKHEQPDYENIKVKEPFYENVKDAPPVYENVKDAQPVYENFDVSSDIYNEVDYVNIVNLENSKNNVEYMNEKKDCAVCDQDDNKIETGRDEDIFGMLTDIKFNGPTENQLISTSFSESNDINDEQDWDSGSDTRSSSSGEFIWKLEDVKPMEGIAEESTDDESDVSSGTSDEEGEAPEFVPSAWDKFATPMKSALRSPEKTLGKTEKNKSKGVWFKKQKYHCVYEYPREPESPVLQSHDLWKPQLDYSSFTDWEFDADTYFPTSVDDNDIFPSGYSYQPKSVSSRNLYQLTNISDFVPSIAGLEDEFFVSSSARPFDAVSNLSSQFFPGGSAWNGENATPDSGMEDGTPGSSTETNEPDVKTHLVVSLKNLASEAVKKSKQTSIKSNDSLGGLRHTRNKLKLDLPPSPSAFTSTKMFTVEPMPEPVIREKPTFTTFGKSRFSVQHVDTPPDESKNKNVSFEALPYKPLAEMEPCEDVDHQSKFSREKHILQDKFDCGKGHSEFIRGEASLLDSADEDSGIESSTLERKTSNYGLLQ
ncbi:uncharacterized protein LOC108913857 isoform X2 [Anoplophora glabripennis]|uniref:uncharacterized protein LOC108913857 isoform X2 n=1 Tax=Anoplophora glabripennis TaxID=217634 RepID=UPI000C7699A9|nr:uncharacterized protein LOC108913857 isoform X2 [Anoplophora glabripennis]